MSATRRRVLKIMGVAAAAPLRPGLVVGAAQLLGACGGSSSEAPVPDPGINPPGSPLRIPPVLIPSSATATEDFYVLSVDESEVEILPGTSSRILGFDGVTPGPTIRARAGRPVTVSLLNNLPQTTLGGAPGEVVIHLHGGHVPASEDGFPTDGQHLLGGELAWVCGPFSAQGEIIAAFVDGDGVSDKTFYGSYLTASYFLTGEHRKYDQKLGVFGRTKPSESFSLSQSEWGALEAAVRWSYLTLNDGSVRGGILNNFTFGLNWYLYSNPRLMANYVLSNRNGLGQAHIAQSRVSLDF